jgi:MFS transporter, Spinster family, sphingosine-1-phosphate transporter
MRSAAGKGVVIRAGIFTVVLLCLINLLNYIDRNIVAGILKTIGQDLLNNQFDSNTILFYKGIIHYSLVFSYVIFAPLISFLVDKRGWKRKVVIIPGIFLWCIATGLGGFVESYQQLLLTRALVGIGEACFVATAPGLIADYFPVEKRGRILMWFYLAGPLGVALAYMLAPNIASLFGNDWRYAFFLVGFPGILLGLLFFFVKEPSRGASHFTNQPDTPPPTMTWTKGELKRLVKNRSYVYVTAGMTALTFGMWGIAFFLPQYFHDVFAESHNLTMGQTGMMVGVSMIIGGMLGTLLGGFLADYFNKFDKRGYFRVSGFALFLCAPVFVVVFNVQDPWLFLVFSMLAQILMLINMAPSHAIILNVTVPSIRTTAFALNMFFMHVLGDMISPPIIGGIGGIVQAQTGVNQVTGLYWGFLIVPFMLVLAGYFFWKGGPYYEGDVDAVEMRINHWSQTTSKKEL